MKNTKSILITKIQKVILMTNFFITMLATQLVFVYATDKDGGGTGTLKDSSFVTNTVRLLNDASSALLVLLPIVGIVMWTLNNLKQQASEEEPEINAYKKKKKNIIIGVISGEVFAGLFKIVLGYYGVTVS